MQLINFVRACRVIDTSHVYIYSGILNLKLIKVHSRNKKLYRLQ